jgi:hypothetical protein
MAQCKKNVGNRIIAYPCVVEADHDGPCMANENIPSQHARRAWLAAVELEAEKAYTLRVAPPAEEQLRQRQVPHPNAEPLSAFQGPARTSQTGLMEHEEEGISGPTPLTTIDTNAPGQGRTKVVRRRPDTIWAGEPVAVNPPPSPSQGQTEPTKQREGDQPLPVDNGGEFVQQLVIDDIKARIAVGIERYGTPLKTFNGRNVDQDLYEELIDASTYLRQRLVERVEMAEAVVGLTRLLEETYTELPGPVWDYLNLLFQGTHG